MHQMQRTQGLSKGGLIEIRSPGGDVRYIPTYTCCHCNSIFVVPEDATEMGFCQRCHARECLGCGHRLNGRCLPFERQIERQERRARLLVAVGAD